MRSIFVFVSVIVIALAAWSSAARADTETDRQIAQTLFDEGRTLMEAQRYAEACRKFAESQRLDPGGGTLLNLAVCHELEGKTGTAWTEFKDALGIATRDDRKDRADLAREHLASLEPRLTRLLIALPEPLAAKDPEVLLDRSKINAAAWGTAIPIDPGDHTVVVALSATNTTNGPMGPRWETRVSATEAGKTYRVDVPLLEAAPPITPKPHAREERVRSKAFWIVLGGAGVAFATGVATGVGALLDDQYVKDNCSAERQFCRVDDADSVASRAKTLAWISTGALAVAVGATFGAFFLPLETRATVSVGPVGDAVAGSSMGLRLRLRLATGL